MIKRPSYMNVIISSKRAFASNSLPQDGRSSTSLQLFRR